MALKIDPSLNPAAPRERAAPSATDFRQFAALRRGAEANDPATLREVARQFESIFTKMMLDSMRSASFGDPMFGSDQADMYQGMMDDQMAVHLTTGRGIGLDVGCERPRPRRQATSAFATVLRVALASGTRCGSSRSCAARTRRCSR